MESDPSDASDLSEIERRLAGWQPAGDTRSTDRWLFAAGQQSMRRRHSAWRGACAFCGLIAVLLGSAWLHERSVRQDLVAQLQTRPPASQPWVPEPPAVVPDVPLPSSYSYLAARKALWAEVVEALPDPPIDPLLPEPSGPILQSHSNVDAIER